MRPSFKVKTVIGAATEVVFAAISDLPRHEEWAANELTITPLTSAPVGVGCRYQSEATVKNMHFSATLEVVVYEPPKTFAFKGQDKTGLFHHQFEIQPLPAGVGVTLTRHITFELTLQQWVIYQLLFYPVRLPAAKTALQQLKQSLERG